MKAFFLGAGCSYGTLENYNACPISSAFGDYLERWNGWRDYENLRKIAKYLGYSDKKLSKMNLEDLWSFIDHYAKFGKPRGFLKKSHKWSHDDAVCELKRALLRLCGTACEDAAKAIRKTSGCTIVDILLHQVKPGDIVVSFNWDTLVEGLAKKFGLELVHGSSRPRKKTWFAKPHGSVAWRIGTIRPNQLNGQPLLDPLPEGSIVAGSTNTEPLLLGAVPMKSELIAEVQERYCARHVFDIIMIQWQAVLEAVRKADAIVVLGYGFPREDEYGRFFFKEGMRRRVRRLKSVEYYDTRCEVGCAIREVFGPEPQIIWRGPVKPPGRRARTRRR